MAPKKGKKKGSKKKDKKEADGDQAPEITVLDKNYFLTQIQALERTLDRSSQRCDQLSSAEQHARDQYRSLHQEKVDIVCFLRESLQAREDEIEELRSRLTGLLKARQTERDNYEEKLKNLGHEFDQMKSNLSDKVLSLTRKLESLEEFRLQKENLESQHTLLQSTLTKEREEHQEKVGSLLQMSILERSAIEEGEALRKFQEERIIEITEELRRGARKEMHSTTRSALLENETLKQTLEVIKSKVVKLRQENSQLRTDLGEIRVREAVLQDSLVQMTSISERRSILLSKVAEKADQHSRIVKDYDCLQTEKEKIRRDLQQMQVQLDASTRLTCELRESSSEKALALELLSTKLQEERTERRRLSAALNSALQILQESIFGGPEVFKGDDNKPIVTNVILTQLVDILSGAERQKLFSDDEADKNEVRSKIDGSSVSQHLVTYSTGDLGLVPRKAKSKSK